jgi:hypothetical protein
MYRAIAGILFSLVLTFFTTGISEAEVWVCAQPNGTTLYTNEPQEAGCQKFEPVSELIYLPPRIWPDPPTPEPTDENQELEQPEAQIASIEDAQTVAPSNERESYNSTENSFWSSEENRIYTWTYTYVPRFYGIYPPRSKHLRDFEGRPRTKHDTKHRIPLFRQSVPRSLAPSVSPMPAEPRHFRETPARGSIPTLPKSVTPNPSRLFRDTSDGKTAPVVQYQSPASSPSIKRSLK